MKILNVEVICLQLLLWLSGMKLIVSFIYSYFIKLCYFCAGIDFSQIFAD
jgi:hypothetical protein